VRDPRERLRDILDAIGRIESYAVRGRRAFARHLQIIGEAVRALPQDVGDRTSHVPWSKIVGMRHILSARLLRD